MRPMLKAEPLTAQQGGLIVGMSVEIIMFFSLLCNVAIMKEHSDRSC